MRCSEPLTVMYFFILATVIFIVIQIPAAFRSGEAYALAGGEIQSVLNFADEHRDAVISLGWGRTFGGGGIEQADSIIQTSDGGYAIIGLTTSYGTGGYDLWLVKIDSSGNEEWSRTFGGDGNEHGSSVIQTSDGGYVLAGSTSSYGAYNFPFASSGDFWLVKTDSLGNEEWSRTFGGGGDDHAFSVIQTSDGGYALAGFTGSYGTGNQDFWLVKTDFSGNEEWSRTFGGENNEYAYSVVQTSDGGYALVGVTRSYGAGGGDFWLVKTDSSGNEEWSRTFGGDYWDRAYSVIQAPDGGYALVGATRSYGAGNGDLWLVKTDFSGNEEWSKVFGGGDDDQAHSIIQTSDGGYALAGFTGSYGAGEYDFWLVKTDSSGNEEWSRTFGGSGFEWAYSVIQTSDGGYALAGYTTSYGASKHDFWVVKACSVSQNTPTSTEGAVTADIANFITFNFRVPT